MANYRKDRVNEELARELAMILRDVKDPRVSDAFISVTAVDCAADLKTAKVYYSSMGGKDGDAGVAKGLSSASGYVRRELAIRLNLRQTPELRFIRDNSIEHGAHISELMKEVTRELEEIDAREAAEKAEGEDEENG